MTNIVDCTLIAGFLLLAAVPAFAEDAPEQRKSFVITRTDTPPKLDGRLDDPVWRDAVVVNDFHQQTPRYRDPASEETHVRLLYDNDYLYIGVDLRDRNPAGIKATQLIQGGNTRADDRFFISIDSFNSRRNDYVFTVNANGIRTEVLRENNTSFIPDWVAIWQAESAINEQGWATEIAIPFKSIAFDPGSDTWGVNFGRWIVRKREFDLWSSNERMWWAAEAGEMRAIQDIQQGRGLDVVPSLNVIHRRDFNPGRQSSMFEPALDLFYKITPALSAALTLNTDFSTAEVDQQQVALDRFLLFFPEKRDFFLQDAGIFEFGNLNANGRPFFSRRIGLSGDGVPIGIDGGAKLTGRLGRFNIGVLGVRQDAYDGISGKNLFVGRLSANVLSESSVGMIVTHGDPTSNASNTLVGTDFIYRNSDGPFGQVVQGQIWFQETDAPGLSDNNQAFGAGFEFPNDLLQVRVNAQEIQENFKPALGFVNRAGIRRYDALIRYRTRPESSRWREIDNQIEAMLVTDVAGRVLSRTTRVRPVMFRSQREDAFFIEWERNHEQVVESFSLFGRLEIPAGSYQFDRYRAEVSTGHQRPVSIVVSVQNGDFFGGDRIEKLAELQWRQSEHFFLGLGFRENVVELPSGQFTSHLASLRTDIAFNARWAWSNLIQYDNTAEVFGVNSRLRYEPVAGREVLLVLNHRSDVSVDNSLSSASDEIALKLSYTFRY